MHAQSPTPPNESKRERYRRWFRIFDANGDGHIDEKDFVILFERVATVRRAQSGPAREILGQAARVRFQMILAADADGDGRVTEDEYLAAAFAQRDPGAELDALHEGLARGGFASFDVDGDGVLNLQDFVLTHVAFGLNPRLADVIARFDAWDTNGDGVITLEEFLPGYRRHQFSEDEMPFIFSTE